MLVQFELSPAWAARAYDDLAQALEPDAPDVPLVQFVRILEQSGGLEQTELVMPGDWGRIEQMYALREAVPYGVNARILRAKQNQHPSNTKMAAILQNRPAQASLRGKRTTANACCQERSRSRRETCAGQSVLNTFTAKAQSPSTYRYSLPDRHDGNQADRESGSTVHRRQDEPPGKSALDVPRAGIYRSLWK